ncbi:hypothetical protein [Ideonella sp.]|uniref:hypothetical protein n=1 Tax=Ideonella sp. TaxID=1929293 RepID=UPI0035B2A614
MTFLRNTATAAVLIAATLSPALAQTKKELAAKVVQLQQPAVESLARDMAADTAGRLMSAAGPALARVPADKREPLAKQVQADVKAFYDEMLARLKDSAARQSPAILGPMLEERLTEDELRQVITWLESSAARKYQELGIDMQQAIARKITEDTRATMEPKLKALEQTLQKRFAAAAPASGASAPAKPAPKK